MIRINKRQFEQFRKANGREIFCTKEATYDIVLAQFLCQRKSTITIDVEALATAVGYDQRPTMEDGYLCFTSKVVLEHAHVQSELDLKKPLILANGKLIDGHHRLYRAFLFGMDELEAYDLTSEEVKIVAG